MKNLTQVLGLPSINEIEKVKFEGFVVKNNEEEIDKVIEKTSQALSVLMEQLDLSKPESELAFDAYMKLVYLSENTEADRIQSYKKFYALAHIKKVLEVLNPDFLNFNKCLVVEKLFLENYVGAFITT